MPAVIVFLIPFLLTLVNIYSFLICLMRDRDSVGVKLLEAVGIGVGVVYFELYTTVLCDITYHPWYTQLYNNQKHYFFSQDSLPTLHLLLTVTVLSYIILRYIPTAKLPPLLAAFGIGGTYIGVAFGIALCIQLRFDIAVLIFVFNCILLLTKAVCLVVKRRSIQIQSGEHPTKFKSLSRLTSSIVGLPLLGFVALVPLAAILLLIMTLFGQEPSEAIRLWTETADWTFSQKIPPQNIAYDEHYLCTVAAGGHKKVVKPQRTGIRHGHRVLVNRQLCIANAFEEVIQHRTPRFHRVVRAVYDSSGYPLAKHIKSKYVADIIYYIMKPLEWLFLAVLYTACAHPEDRIAVQYPHSKPPTNMY